MMLRVLVGHVYRGENTTDILIHIYPMDVLDTALDCLHLHCESSAPNKVVGDFCIDVLYSSTVHKFTS